jgi:hypothetical protein
MGKQFQVLFCRRFQCPAQEYEKQAFGKCLYWHAKPLAPVLRILNPEFFRRDYGFIRYLGEAPDMRDVKAAASSFRNENRRNPSFLRTGLRIRVSGRKAVRLARRLFAEERQDEAGTN